MEAETNGQASCCNHGPDNKIDDIMVPQIDRRDNKANDDQKIQRKIDSMGGNALF